MKRINILIFTIILSIILLVTEIIIVRKAVKYEPKRKVVFADINIKAGVIIKEEMLAEKEIATSNIHEQSFKDKREIIGKKSKSEFFKGEMILKGRLYDKEDSEDIQVLDKENRLFTVEFKGDQVNGWWLKEGQYVDIIYIPSEKAQKDTAFNGTKGLYGTKRVKNVRIAAIIDEKGKLVKDKDSDNESTSKYISFEVDDKLDEFLAYSKGNGRLEVSLIPDKQALE